MKRIAAICVGTGLVALLVISVVARSNKELPRTQLSKVTAKKPKPTGHYVAPKDPGPPASPEAMSKATEEARVKSTYLNFRTAVATGNRRIQNSLKRVLTRNQDLALKFAQEDLANATEAKDQDIAQKTLEALRP